MAAMDAGQQLRGQWQGVALWVGDDKNVQNCKKNQQKHNNQTVHRRDSDRRMKVKLRGQWQGLAP